MKEKEKLDETDKNQCNRILQKIKKNIYIYIN